MKEERKRLQKGDEPNKAGVGKRINWGSMGPLWVRWALREKDRQVK